MSSFHLEDSEGAGYGGTDFAVMELMDHGSVSQALRAAGHGQGHPDFNPTQESKVLFGIAATMTDLHGHDIKHGVLSLDSVFLDEHCERRIEDFGVHRLEPTVNEGDDLCLSGLICLARKVLSEEGIGLSPADASSYGSIVYRMFPANVDLDSGRPSCNPFRVVMDVRMGHRPLRTGDIPDNW